MTRIHDTSHDIHPRSAHHPQTASLHTHTHTHTSLFRRPSYLAEDCSLVADARERRLHSTASRTCVVMRTRLYWTLISYHTITWHVSNLSTRSCFVSSQPSQRPAISWHTSTFSTPSTNSFSTHTDSKTFDNIHACHMIGFLKDISLYHHI